jgi:hypothetical protein
VTGCHHNGLWNWILLKRLYPSGEVFAADGFLDSHVGTRGIFIKGNLIGTEKDIPKGLTSEEGVQTTAIFDMVFSSKEDPV